MRKKSKKKQKQKNTKTKKKRKKKKTKKKKEEEERRRERIVPPFHRSTDPTLPRHLVPPTHTHFVPPASIDLAYADPYAELTRSYASRLIGAWGGGIKRRRSGMKQGATVE